MPTVIRFGVNAVATANKIAPVLEPMGLKARATWNHANEPAVHIGLDERRIGTGMFLAAGQQLVIGDDGRISIQEASRA